ncbi:MAG TPA: hypothetical protein QF656_01860 [Nitrosopumilus sp.]|jgi:predicted DNA binding CopG/RHH family protein|nr:hypothetical protein [Nitrosopumilus sp.]
MNPSIILTVVIFSLILVVPTVNAQLSIGPEAKQELIEVKLNLKGEINVKHVAKSSNMPASLPLFSGEISNLIIKNEDGEETISGIANDGKGNQSVVLLPSKQKTIIEYNLENINLNNNLFSTEISYPEKFSVVFDESIELIFINGNLIFLDGKKGISVNGGGNINIEYYSNPTKIIEKIEWEEDKFDVEIITDSKVEKFNFEQTSKSMSFEINEKNKFFTLTFSEELLGGPYIVLLDDEKIKYTKYDRVENITSLNVKPESTGVITIIGTTVIPEFSMFIPLIMGFLVVLTVPFMKKFNLH